MSFQKIAGGKNVTNIHSHTEHIGSALLVGDEYFMHFEDELGHTNTLDVTSAGTGSSAWNQVTHTRNVNSGAGVGSSYNNIVRDLYNNATQKMIAGFVYDLADSADGVGVARHCMAGFCDDFTKIPFAAGGPSFIGFYQDSSNNWWAGSGIAATHSKTAIADPANNDILGIIATVNEVMLYVNGILVHKENSTSKIPVAATLLICGWGSIGTAITVTTGRALCFSAISLRWTGV